MDHLFIPKNRILEIGRIFYICLLFIIIPFRTAYSQTSGDTVAYLITCSPGTDTYSIYGHSALRIVIPDKNTDAVFNWGVFDFDTPDFAWKFAKGRLDYMLIEEPLKGFLQEYYLEKRSVWSQKINLNTREIQILVRLINENIKPENAKYRYDFFYDDCSTRIRDLLEKSIGKNLKYPPKETGKSPTFRDLVGKYQNPYPWLLFGVNLIMGSTADKKADFRDRMFLPLDMKEGLSKAVIFRSDKMIPLLQNPETMLQFDEPQIKQRFFTSPPFLFTLIIIIILVISALTKSKKIIRAIDLVLFSVFSVLSVLMIFFNFFTDHEQMKWNLNIIWINPFIIACLVALILNRAGTIWFRLVFFLSAGFIIFHFMLPQEFDLSFLLLAFILLLRSSVRSGFEWNPLSLK